MIKIGSRGKRLFFNVVGNFFARAVNLGSTLIIVPVSIAGLGPAQYGMLAVVLSASTLFYYADFGLGSAIVNHLSVSEKNASWQGIDRVVSRIWSFLCVVTAVIGVGGAIFVGIAWKFHFDFGGVLGTPATQLVLIESIAIGIPSTLSQRAMFALQRNVEAATWGAGCRLASVFGVVAAQFCNAGIEYYVFSLVALPAIVNWIACAYFFLYSRRDLRPKIVRFKLHEISGDIRVGIQFLILNFALFVQTGIDNILIGFFHGSRAVSNYDVMFRLFNYVPALSTIAVFPLWPALRNALSDGDYNWFSKMRKNSYALIVLISVLTSVIMAAFYKIIILRWTGISLQNETALALGFMALGVLMAFGGVQSMILNARGYIGIQAKIYLAATAIILPTKIAALYAYGPSAMVWTLVAVLSVQLAILELSTSGRFASIQRNAWLSPVRKDR